MPWVSSSSLLSSRLSHTDPICSCGEVGHMARECPTNPTGGAGNDGKCFNCGEDGQARLSLFKYICY